MAAKSRTMAQQKTKEAYCFIVPAFIYMILVQMCIRDRSGDYYRLINPFENNNHVLWQFVSKDKKETVVCGVRLHSEANPYIYLFYPQGLDADLHYEDIATGKVYTGAALMKAGLPLPLTTGDYQPIRFTFKAVEK